MSQIVIPREFNGPRDSGNGGYACGTFAALVEGSAEVSLRSPVPLETPLWVERDGGGIRVGNGETLVAEATPAPPPSLDVPAPVGLAEAAEASAAYRGLRGGPFSACFVCGLDREDSLGVFAGRVPGRDVVASPWTPPPSSAGADGLVRDEIAWAVLDCPTFFAAYLDRDDLPVAFLVRQEAEIEGPIRPEEELVVIGWPIETGRNKALAGSAVLSAEGDVLAVSRILLVEPRV